MRFLKESNKAFKPELVLAGGPGPVDLVAEDEDGAVAELLVCQQGLKLDLALTKPGPVAAVHQEHDGVHRGEVILPHPPGLVMAPEVECGEPETLHEC